MRERFEGDEVFCLVALIAARTLVSSSGLLIGMGLPVSRELLVAVGDAVQTALILGLFYGPASRRISKRVFGYAFLVLTILLLLAELL